MSEHRVVDDDIARLVAHMRPGRPPRAVTLAGAGVDNVAYDVDGELVVRFLREPEPGRVTTEARILAIAATCAPPAVPQPLVVDEAAGALVYPRLGGTPLLELRNRFPAIDLERFGATIGASGLACTACCRRPTTSSRPTTRRTRSHGSRSRDASSTATASTCPTKPVARSSGF